MNVFDDQNDHSNQLLSNQINNLTSLKKQKNIVNIEEISMSLKEHHHFHHQNDDDGPHIYHGIDLTKVNLSSLPKSQQEHLLMHEKHRGHEKMHAVMLLILILSMFLAQILLIWWRKKSFKSYQNVSMFG